jgi:hypothetical protein
MSDARTALIDLLHFCETTPRQRSRVEAPEEKTYRILRLEIAWALARVGDAEAHRVYAVPALSALQAGDPLEQCAGELYETRLREAREGNTTGPWPSSVVERLQGFEGFNRYKVERLIEKSQVLSPWTTGDPIAKYWNPSLTAVHARPCADLETAELVSARLRTLPTNPDRSKLRVEWGQCLRTAAPLGLDCVLSAVPVLQHLWPLTTDAYNTNSHWAVSVIELFDGLSFAIAEAVNPLVRPEVTTAQERR